MALFSPTTEFLVDLASLPAAGLEVLAERSAALESLLLECLARSPSQATKISSSILPQSCQFSRHRHHLNGDSLRFDTFLPFSRLFVHDR